MRVMQSVTLRSAPAALLDGLHRLGQAQTDAACNFAALALVMRAQDPYTQGHAQRVADYAEKLSRKLGLCRQEIEAIRLGALLHDIGKMAVPDRILHKHGPLTEAEKAIMRQHPLNAYNMLYPIAYLRSALEIPVCHQEKWDGSGYPRGLRGEDIPLAARIFTVIDVWDALRSDRPYRKAWSVKKTIAYIEEQAGKSFDPRIVKTFVEVIPSIVGKNEVVL